MLTHGHRQKTIQLLTEAQRTATKVADNKSAKLTQSHPPTFKYAEEFKAVAAVLPDANADSVRWELARVKGDVDEAVTALICKAKNPR